MYVSGSIMSRGPMKVLRWYLIPLTCCKYGPLKIPPYVIFPSAGLTTRLSGHTGLTPGLSLLVKKCPTVL